MNGLRSIDMNRGRQIHTCILESRQIDCRFSVCFYECFFLYNLIPIMSARWKYIYIFVLFPLILFKTILEKNKKTKTDRSNLITFVCFDSTPVHWWISLISARRRRHCSLPLKVYLNSLLQTEQDMTLNSAWAIRHVSFSPDFEYTSKNDPYSAKQ